MVKNIYLVRHLNLALVVGLRPYIIDQCRRWGVGGPHIQLWSPIGLTGSGGGVSSGTQGQSPLIKAF